MVLKLKILQNKNRCLKLLKLSTLTFFSSFVSPRTSMDWSPIFLHFLLQVLKLILIVLNSNSVLNSALKLSAILVELPTLCTNKTEQLQLVA